MGGTELHRKLASQEHMYMHAWDAQDSRADVCMGLVAAQVIDTVSKACAYGAYDKLQEFVAADPGCVNAPDESGYFPLQWAALNNRMSEANYLLAQGASVNATDHTGQTALHWAAVRGSLPVIETLLRNHADCELKDNKGYTVAHVAAQYGQTAVLYHLVRWDTAHGNKKHGVHGSLLQLVHGALLAAHGAQGTRPQQI